MNRVTLFAVAVWACLIGGVSAADAPAVALAGKYAELYRALYTDAGCRALFPSPEELARPAYLRQCKMVHLAHWSKIPDAVQRALVQYVRQGGTVLYSYSSVPAAEFFDGNVPVLEEGTPATIRIADDAQTFFAGVPQVMKYRAWGFLLDLPRSFPRGSVLAYYDAPDAGVQVSEPFRTRRPAIFRLTFGKGQVFYSGPHLSYPPGDRLLTTLIHRVMPETNPMLDFAIRLSEPVLAENRVSGDRVSGDRVAVFREPGFPAAGMPEDASPAFIHSALTKNGMNADYLSAADLEQGIDPALYNTLILSYGETFPAEAYPAFKRFVAVGGAVVAPAGIPLSRPVRRENGAWREIVPPRFRDTVISAVFKHLIPAAKYMKLPDSTDRIVNYGRERFASDLPLVWPGRTGYSILPVPGESCRNVLPLLASLDSAGAVSALPLSFQPVHECWPESRFVLLGLTGREHPWSPAAWPHAERAITEMTRLAMRRDWAALTDLHAMQPIFFPGEAFRVSGTLRRSGGKPTRVLLQLFARDSDRILARQIITTPSGASAATFEAAFPQPDDGGEYYDLIASLEDGAPAMPQRTLLMVKRPGTSLAGPVFGWRDHTPLLNGKPQRLNGVNFYSEENRSLGIFVPGLKNPSRLPDVWERDLMLLKLIGGNATRSHYLEDMLGPGALRDTGAFAARTLDAARQLHARFGMAMILSPFTFAPNIRPSWSAFAPNSNNVYTDPAQRAVSARYLDELATYCSSSPNIVWEVINEPEGNHPRTAGADASAIRAWTTEMAGILSRRSENRAVGIGNAIPENTNQWNIRENLNGIVKWGHIHPYYEELLKPESDGNSAFGMNFSYPALLGEVGLPNASSSTTPKLGDWGRFYEKLLALALAEEAIGFQNFYLSYAMWPESPEWGLLLPEQIEREGFKRWKLWSRVQQALPPGGFLPPRNQLRYHSADRKKAALRRTLTRAYVTLAGNGVRCRIGSESDRPEERNVWLLFSPESESWAGKEASELKTRGISVQLIPYDRAEETLRKIRPASAPVTLDTGKFEYNYLLPHRDGNYTAILVGASGKEAVLNVGRHRWSLRPAPDSAVIFTVAGDGAPELIQMQGELRIDGKTFFASPAAPAAWIVTTGEIVADHPASVVTARLPRNPLEPGASFFLGDGFPAEMREAFAALLKSRGMKLVSTPQEDAYLVERSAAPEHLLMRGGVWPEIHFDGLRRYEPWSALVKVTGRRAEIYGTGDAAVFSALMQLASSRSFRSFSVGPYHEF